MIAKNKSIKTRYLFSGLAICLISLLLVSLTSYLVSYNITAAQSNMRIQQAAMRNASELDFWFQHYGVVIENIVEDIGITGNYSPNFLYQFLKNKLQMYHQDVLDFYIGFADPGRKLVSGENWVPPQDYDCRTRVWYREALLKKRLIFTEPYVDVQTGKMVITLAKPIWRDGKAIGVLAADLVVDHIIQIVKAYRLSESSYAFLLDQKGDVLVHPQKAFQPNANGLKNIRNVIGRDYRKLARAIQSGGNEIVALTDYDGKTKYFILSRINSSGWVFGITIQQSEYKKPLNYLLYGFAFALLVSTVVGVSIMLKLINGMIRPIQSLSDTVKSFSTANMTVRASINSQDELGELGRSFNQMADTIQEYSISLENKVAARTRELKEKNDKIMESIDYAERLQRAILPPLPQRLGIAAQRCFVIWQPRDVVGGDIYWCRGDENQALLAVADCTGHSVPGALMTMALSSILDALPRSLQDTTPAALLGVIHARLQETLGQENQDSIANDGADLALCLFDKVNRKILFSGARLSLFVARDGQITEYKGTRQSVGYFRKKELPFTDYEIEWTPGITCYYTTDGLLDQNAQAGKGGLGRSAFMELLKSITKLPLDQQQKALEELIAARITGTEQRDDITVIGIAL